MPFNKLTAFPQEFIKDVQNTKYNSNIRHSAIIGGSLFLSYKDGKLFYLDHSGIEISREMKDCDGLFSLFFDKRRIEPGCRIEGTVAGQEYLSFRGLCVMNEAKESGIRKIIAKNGFIGLQIDESGVVELIEWVRHKNRNFGDVDCPMRRRITSSFGVYVSPDLLDVLSEWANNKNAENANLAKR